MKSTATLLNDYRLKPVRTGEDGGAAIIKYKGLKGTVIWSNGGGWEHVSFNPWTGKTPSWEDMCLIKDIFFEPEEVAIQIHPARSQYVSNLNHCLHLWRCTSAEQPLPPSIMVGIRDGQSLKSVMEEIAEVEQ